MEEILSGKEPVPWPCPPGCPVRTVRTEVSLDSLFGARAQRWMRKEQWPRKVAFLSRAETDQQKKALKDPKKMAGMGLQAGMGFVPFGGLALGGFKLLTKDDTSRVLAAAPLTLARDPDPKSGQALADAATGQEKWLVRAAAFDAIAVRGDPSLLHVAVDGLQDKQDEVQYSAAGAVIRLSDIQAKPPAHPKPAPTKGKSRSKKNP